MAKISSADQQLLNKLQRLEEEISQIRQLILNRNQPMPIDQKKKARALLVGVKAGVFIDPRK